MERRNLDAKSFSDSKNTTSHDSETLVLTPNISFQQKRKRANYGERSKIFSSPPYFCNRRKVIILKKEVLGKVYSVQLKNIPCNSWGCPDCRVMKAKRLRRKLIEIIELNELNHLLTLTLDPSMIPHEYVGKTNRTGKYITYLFNRYMTTLKRKMEKSIKYVWVKEFQKNGNAHLHIVLSTFLPIDYLRSEWVRIGGGHIMDIQRIKDIRAVARYISGYLTKMAKATYENFLVGERRHSVSHSCLKPPRIFVPTKISIQELTKYLPVDKYYLVYNLWKYSDIPETEIILAPHQEKLNL